MDLKAIKNKIKTIPSVGERIKTLIGNYLEYDDDDLLTEESVQCVKYLSMNEYDSHANEHNGSASQAETLNEILYRDSLRTAHSQFQNERVQWTRIIECLYDATKKDAHGISQIDKLLDSMPKNKNATLTYQSNMEDYPSVGFVRFDDCYHKFTTNAISVVINTDRLNNPALGFNIKTAFPDVSYREPGAKSKWGAWGDIKDRLRDCCVSNEDVSEITIQTKSYKKASVVEKARLLLLSDPKKFYPGCSDTYNPTTDKSNIDVFETNRQSDGTEIFKIVRKNDDGTKIKCFISESNIGIKQYDINGNPSITIKTSWDNWDDPNLRDFKKSEPCLTSILSDVRKNILSEKEKKASRQCNFGIEESTSECCKSYEQ